MTFQASGIRLKSWKAGGSITLRYTPGETFNLPTFNVERSIDESLLIGGDALAEHVIRPALIDEDDWDKNQGDNRHDR